MGNIQKPARFLVVVSLLLSVAVAVFVWRVESVGSRNRDASVEAFIRGYEISSTNKPTFWVPLSNLELMSKPTYQWWLYGDVIRIRVPCRDADLVELSSFVNELRNSGVSIKEVVLPSRMYCARKSELIALEKIMDVVTYECP